ncbi:restriction endonuclease subunit S [Verrucomicrobiaceae bacterium R5-34]|nr:restriction endonuclease subunit S [Verrucomicrobiaceae bacterium R5-34]
MNNVALVNDDLDSATASTGYCVLRPISSKLNSRYLFHWVQTNSFVSDMMRLATGANYPAVSDKIVKGSAIPLPPLAEQKRIAAILDKADAIRRKRQQALDLTDTFLRSTFLHMFGDPVTNPMGWERAKLGEIIKFQGGSQPSKDTFEFKPTDENVRLVQIRDFKSDKYITYIPKRLAKRSFKEDDVMIARYGPPVFQILKGLSGSYNVALMKAIPLKGINKHFLFHLLNTERITDAVVSKSERSAGQTGVNLDFLNNYLAYCPSQKTQDKFGLIVERMEIKIKKLISNHELSQNLFSSLQQRAFKGKF